MAVNHTREPPTFVRGGVRDDRTFTLPETLAIGPRHVLDAHLVRNAKTASEFVEITLIRTVSQDQQVGVGDLAHNMRQCLDDPVMSLIPLEPAAGNDPARNGDRPGARRW